MFKRASLIAAVLGYIVVSEAAAAQLVDRRLFASDAVYKLHLANATFRHCDLNRDGAFQPEELPCYDSIKSSENFSQPTVLANETAPMRLGRNQSAERVPLSLAEVRRNSDDDEYFNEPFLRRPAVMVRKAVTIVTTDVRKP